MSRRCSRRSILQATAAMSASLGGCSMLTTDEQLLDFVFRNYTTTKRLITVYVFRLRGADTYHDAEVLDEQYSLPKPEDGSGHTQMVREGVLPSRPYVIRFQIGQDTLHDFHFFPACRNRDAHDTVYLYVYPPEDEPTPYEVLLDQFTCGS